MIIRACDGCRRRIADDDAGAARDLPLGGERVDWCGDCVAIVRAELPRLAAEAREAQRTFGERVKPMREIVQQRARNLWSRDTPPPRPGQMIVTGARIPPPASRIPDPPPPASGARPRSGGPNAVNRL